MNDHVSVTTADEQPIMMGFDLTPGEYIIAASHKVFGR
jgi:hypothetical protein